MGWAIPRPAPSVTKQARSPAIRQDRPGSQQLTKKGTTVMIPAGSTYSPDHLWAAYIELPHNPYMALAGAMADWLIRTDPERFAVLLSEAQAAR